jgi:hypothetical protein
VRQYVEDEVRAPDGMGTKEDKRGKRRTNIQQTAADEWHGKGKCYTAWKQTVTAHVVLLLRVPLNFECHFC